MVLIPADQMAQIEEHARETYPEECCGILIGLRAERPAVYSAYRAQNRNFVRSFDRYELDPRDILTADRAAENENQEILGFYHSHPDHPPLPSATDAEHAWPGYLYLIVAVTERGETESRGWSWSEQRQLEERPIEQSQRSLFRCICCLGKANRKKEDKKKRWP
jgi:proteasome lid subunit RPN8/RPN11